MKKKTLTIFLVLTLLSSMFFAQSVLGANYYRPDGQRNTKSQDANTYYNSNKVNSDKTGNSLSSQQRVYYVYPTAFQGDNYYPVFVNRSSGYSVQQPPAKPKPERPTWPEQPTQPEPKPEPERPTWPEQPTQPEPKPEPERPTWPEQPTQPEPEPERPTRPEQPTQPKPEPEPEPPQQSGAHGLTAGEQSLISMINSERVRAGLNALKIDTELSKVARLKSEDMNKNNYFSHTSPTYGSPFTMIKDFGITYRNAGENIAKTYSVERAHEGFMNSEGHRRNILTPGFTHIGVGISGYYYTEMFITK